MLNGLYLGRLDCVKTGTGNIGHLEPIALTELNVHGRNPFTPRHYRRGANGARPDHGFGFAFWPYTKQGVHRARVMVLDLGKWKIRHLVHFMCKSEFVAQHFIIPP